MTTKVEIYQVRNDIDERHDISFMNYSYVTRVIPNLKRDLKNYYKKVYEYEEDFKNRTDEEILESIYVKFNTARPSDFRAHSMSTSDIVILDDSRMWYCDSFGWQEMN